MKKSFTFFLVVLFQSVSAQTISDNHGFTATITPNPVYSTMRVTTTGGEVNETLVVQIYRKGGELVYEGTMRVTGPETVKKIHKPTAPPGLYYYRVTRQKTGEIAEGKIAFQ